MRWPVPGPAADRHNFLPLSFRLQLYLSSRAGEDTSTVPPSWLIRSLHATQSHARRAHQVLPRTSHNDITFSIGINNMFVKLFFRMRDRLSGAGA
jgi:hypothetical protein